MDSELKRVVQPLADAIRDRLQGIDARINRLERIVEVLVAQHRSSMFDKKDIEALRKSVDEKET